MTNPYMDGVASDPVPFITETFEKYGAFARVYDKRLKQTIPTVKAMSAVLGAATAVVNALSTNDDTFVVRFSATAETAATAEATLRGGKERVVIIGVRHWLDEDITDAQRATITIALAFHEVGHVRWSMGWHTRLKKKYGHDPRLMNWAGQVFNLSHDIMLEHLQPLDYPGFRDTLEPKNRYFSVPFGAKSLTAQDRYDSGLQRLKFPWALTSEDEFTPEWDALGERMRSTDALKTRVQNGIIDDALAMLGDLDAPEPDEGEDGEESEEGEDEEGEGEGKDKSEPKVEDADPEGVSDTKDDDEGDDEPGGGGGDDDDTEEGEPEGEPDKGDDSETADDPDGGDGRPHLHEPPDEADAEWQANVDDFNAAQAKGRDLVLTGGGAFHKRELRISRL